MPAARSRATRQRRSASERLVGARLGQAGIALGAGDRQELSMVQWCVVPEAGLGAKVEAEC
jgi:hypothetical protein